MEGAKNESCGIAMTSSIPVLGGGPAVHAPSAPQVAEGCEYPLQGWSGQALIGAPDPLGSSMGPHDAAMAMAA
jgi:hypothetical protein